jgi:prostaglandin-E synthase
MTSTRAQRTNEVYLTIQLADTSVPVVTFTEDSITLTTTCGQKSYALDIQLYAPISITESKTIHTSRSIALVLQKVEQEAAWWPRLLKAEGKKPNWLKVDFGRWVDEDEEEEAAAMDALPGPQGMGAGGMPGMPGGGMGGAGGMDIQSMVCVF